MTLEGDFALGTWVWFEEFRTLIRRCINPNEL